MKKYLFLLPLLLVGCSNSKKTGTTVETVDLSNYQRYITTSLTKAPTYYVDDYLLSFTGCLTFAIYNVQVTYTSLVDTTTQKASTETITLNAAGCGKGNIIIYKTNYRIDNVVGTVEYKL